MDFWRRAEQEFIQFTNKLLVGPNPASSDVSAAEALHGPAREFKRQLQLLEYNRTPFCREVLKQSIAEADFLKQIAALMERADKLHDNEEESDEADTVGGLLHEMVRFTEKIAPFNPVSLCMCELYN